MSGSGDGGARPGVILALEQALALPYCTQRFVQEGWRVIRIESTPRPGARNPGDPNRYAGVGEGDRRSYFVPPNLGKEAIALNLKDARGREILQRLLVELGVDVFAVNLLPKQYEPLGIDFDTLSAARPGLIWVGLSAQGPEFPSAPGYDPAIQAAVGYMHLTGDPEGPPMVCGVPVIDLKAGDEAYARIYKALWQRERTGQGSRIDVSMMRASAQWLVTKTSLAALGHDPASVTRTGNVHPIFTPVDVFPTADGFINLAVGNDLQWESLTRLAPFSHLARGEYTTNSDRRDRRETLCAEIGDVTLQHTTDALAEMFLSARLIHARILDIPGVLDHPAVAPHLLRTRTPDGAQVPIAPNSHDTEFLADQGPELPFPATYGEHTDAVLAEAGLSDGDIGSLRTAGVVA
ncbi:MAG: CoA transferase [Myxococcota bacterium]|jgi:crotonobetainyl-CoA:carnitine CoA-transferase CaiB-like acyl-CoA transferase|nr:CoA transferase [Myxococcota bacterium]